MDLDNLVKNYLHKHADRGAPQDPWFQDKDKKKSDYGYYYTFSPHNVRDYYWWKVPDRAISKPHFPAEMDEMEDFTNQFNQMYVRSSKDEMAKWGEYEISAYRRLGNALTDVQTGGWEVSFLEEILPTEEEAERVAEFLRVNPPEEIKDAIREGRYVDSLLGAHDRRLSSHVSKIERII